MEPSSSPDPKRAREPLIQDRAAGAVNDAIDDMLQRPVRDIFGDMSDEELARLGDVLADRIARRSVGYEKFIDRRYLERLTDIYARFFHGYNDGPLLIVNASQIDPVASDADYDQLFRRIRRTTGGRHFFNPAAAAFA